MAEIKISSGDLAKLLGKDSSSIIDQFTKDGEAIEASEAGRMLADLVKEKVQVNVDREKQRLDPDGVRQRARAEAFKEVNKAFVGHGYEGADWKDQMTAMSEAKTVTTKEITEADVKAHEAYKRDMGLLKEQIATEKKAHEDTQRGYRQKEENQTLESWVLGYINDPKNKYQKIEDQDVVNRRVQDLMRSLREGDHKIVLKDGKKVVVDSSGNPAVDEGFNDVTPEQFLANNAKYYFKKQVTDPKQAPSIPSGGDAPPPSGTDYKIPVMKTEADLDAALDANLAEGGGKERAQALIAHYEQSVAKA